MWLSDPCDTCPLFPSVTSAQCFKKVSKAFALRGLWLAGDSHLETRTKEYAANPLEVQAPSQGWK